MEFQCNAQIISVPIGEFNCKFDQKIEGEKDVLLKIFDPTQAKEYMDEERLSFEDRIQLCEKSFRNEIGIYTQITQYNGTCTNPDDIINIPTIYKCGFITITTETGLYQFCGLYIAMQNLGKEKPSSEQDFENGEKQLKLIHRLNIIHGDIRLANMFKLHDKIYFIDYGFSCNSFFIDCNYSEHDDNEKLNDCKLEALRQRDGVESTPS